MNTLKCKDCAEKYEDNSDQSHVAHQKKFSRNIEKAHKKLDRYLPVAPVNSCLKPSIQRHGRARKHNRVALNPEDEKIELSPSRRQINLKE